MGKICPFLSGPQLWMLSVSWVTMDPSAEACLWTEALHTNLLLLSSLINKFLSLGCQLESYPWPSPINGGSSGCNLDFAIINTCQGKIISSKKTKHGSLLSSTEAVGDNWACQTHGDSWKLVQFEMEPSHVHSKYLIILIKQATVSIAARFWMKIRSLFWSD